MIDPALKLITPGKWYADFDENGNATETFYDISFRKLLGYDSEADFANDQESWTLNVHPDDRERVDAYLADIFSNHPEGKDYDIEYRIMTKWGYHWFHDYAHITRRENGRALHFEGVSFDIQEIKEYEIQQAHDNLRKEVLDYIITHTEEDPIELLSLFAEKVRVVIDCDQVIYRDLEKTRIMVNSPAIEETWSVPFEYCQQCEHLDAHHPMYAGGYTEMDNCQEGWQGIPVYHKCPIKSSLTRLVYCNGEIAGYLAIHFVQKYHHFTEVERKTLEEFCSNFSLLLSRYEAAKEIKLLQDFQQKQTQLLIQNNQRVMALEDNFESLYEVELESCKYSEYVKGEFYQQNVTDKLIREGNFFEDLQGNIDTVIYPEDRAGLKNVLTSDNIRKALSQTDRIEYFYRMYMGEAPVWFKMRVVYKDAEKRSVIIGVFNASEELEAKQIEEQRRQIAEQAAFTNFFLDQYESAHYLGLEDFSWRVYKRSRELDEKYPVLGTYIESLSQYIANEVHPDDKEAVSLLIRPEELKEKLAVQPHIGFNFRVVREDGAEKIRRCDVIRGADANHVAFGFKDVTEEVMEQQRHLLGAVPLSPDILSKANIGLWSFELDEGKPPRMYVDDTMLKLIGLDHQVPPEETYHAWYDHIDGGSYDLVADAVAKMAAGEHAEVQYPWIHPDGHILIVRCGGVPNRGYTKGIRIEGTHQDVTETLHFDEEQTRMVRELATQQRHLKAFSDMINAALWSIEITGENEIAKVEWSDELRKMFGFTDETDFPNVIESWIDRVHPDDKERVWAHFQNSIRYRTTDLVYDIAFRIQHKSGVYVWYHAFGKTEKEDIETRRFYGIMVDISADKELEHQKEQLEENLEIIEALAADYSSVYYIDIDTEKITPYTMNEETERAMSKVFRSSELYPEAFLAYVDQFVYEPDKEMVLREGRRKNVLQKLHEGNSYSIIFRGLEEGVVSFCEMKFVVTRKEGDTIKSVALGFAYKDNDIMAQYINEKLVAEYISAFLVDLDTDSYRIYRHPDSTSVMERDDKVWSLAMADFAQECDKEYYELVKNIGSPEFLKAELADVDRREYHYRFPSASQPWRRSVVQVIDRLNGVPSTIVATFMGIDDFESKIKDQEKQLAVQQEQLKHALAMAQSASRAKTTFLNNMSHDIRTPMNAIIGYTGLAASHIDNKDLVQDYLGKIGQSSDHLLSLINDVLDMSRIESGKMNLNENPENLPDIIHTIRDIVQADIHSKQLDFFVDAVDINDENIICDKLRLNQVILNVLSNSIKYTPAGGTVNMRVTEKTVKETGYATFEFLFKDNGMGMSEDFLKTIFDPFTRVKSSTVSGIQGTGLGMAITKNIVDMMGGKIDVKSEPAKGTEVTIVLDFKLQSAPKIPSAIPELDGLRGLVVDDDSNTCLSVAKMLRETGMRAEWCTSGREAVLRAGEGYKMGDLFKVYIIDWLMPDMNGIETTRRIRKAVGEDVPIIILTVYDWSDIEEEAREAGVTAFVSKPMFPSDLHRVLTKCLGKDEEEKTRVSVDFDLTGKKILLVEDNELNREIATAVLEEFGCSVTPAEDGDVAVAKMAKAAEGDYDLVLMDIQMPTMDGYEATKLIRALGTKISKIPILAMTANAFEEDRKLALEAGMDEHIAKPIDIDKLKETLAKFL